MFLRINPLACPHSGGGAVIFASAGKRNSVVVLINTSEPGYLPKTLPANLASMAAESGVPAVGEPPETGAVGADPRPAVPHPQVNPPPPMPPGGEKPNPRPPPPPGGPPPLGPRPGSFGPAPRPPGPPIPARQSADLRSPLSRFASSVRTK